MSVGAGLLVLVLLAAAGWWPARRLGRWARAGGSGPAAGGDGSAANGAAGPASCDAPWPGVVGAWGRPAEALAWGAAIVGLAQVTLAGVRPADLAVPIVAASLSILAVAWERFGPRQAGRAGRVAGAAPAGRPVAPDAPGEDASERVARGEDASSSPRGTEPSLRALRAGDGVPSLVRRLVGLGVVLVLTTAVAVTTGLPFRGDGSKFWAPKARELARTPALEAPSLVDPDHIGFHRDYPLLAPALLAPAFELAPVDGPAGPKLVLAGLAVALVALAAARLVTRGAAGFTLLAALGTMPALTSPDVRESIGAGGYVDGVAALFLLLLVDAVTGLRAAGNWRGAGGWAATLAGAALVATKLEGVVWVAIVLVSWLLAGPVRRGAPAIAVRVAVLSLPTWWIRSQVVADPSIVDLSALARPDVLAARSVPVLSGLGGVLLDASCFGLAPLLVAVWLARAARRRTLDAFTTWCVLGLAAALLLVYLTTSMHVGRHLYTSVHRLVLHWLPALAVLAAAPARETGVVAGAGVGGVPADDGPGRSGGRAVGSGAPAHEGAGRPPGRARERDAFLEGPARGDGPLAAGGLSP